MNSDLSSAQRLLALGITASTQHLVRGLQDGCSTEHLRGVMSERRRLLHELSLGQSRSASGECLRALREAVAESDRTVEKLIV